MLRNTASIKRALAACWRNAIIALLQGTIQVAVLNELFEGGGFTMVMKDDKGRFYREDVILFSIGSSWKRLTHLPIDKSVVVAECSRDRLPFSGSGIGLPCCKNMLIGSRPIQL